MSAEDYYEHLKPFADEACVDQPDPNAFPAGIYHMDYPALLGSDDILVLTPGKALNICREEWAVRHLFFGIIICAWVAFINDGPIYLESISDDTWQITSREDDPAYLFWALSGHTFKKIPGTRDLQRLDRNNNHFYTVRLLYSSCGATPYENTTNVNRWRDKTGMLSNYRWWF
jgi:hypothetical protein